MVYSDEWTNGYHVILDTEEPVTVQWGQDNDKSCSIWVSIAETSSNAAAREGWRDSKTGGKLEFNPFRTC